MPRGKTLAELKAEFREAEAKKIAQLEARVSKLQITIDKVDDRITALTEKQIANRALLSAYVAELDEAKAEAGIQVPSDLSSMSSIEVEEV